MESPLKRQLQWSRWEMVALTRMMVEGIDLRNLWDLMVDTYERG